MKRINLLYAGALVALSFFQASCNDSEKDLLKPKLYFESNVIKVEVEDDTYECELVSRLSDMVKNDVNVTYQIGGQDLVDEYNQKHGTTGKLMSVGNYVMGESASVIKAGDLYADACELSLKNISKGEDGVSYILPVVVNSSDIAKINATGVTFVVVKKPIIINKVYDINPTWLDVRLPDAFKKASTVTYEALVYADRWKNLGTIMGNEGVLILRTGDLNHPDNELQVAGNVALQIPDVSIFQLNKWYHVAFTYDASSGMATLYLNGEKIVDKTVGTQTFDLNERFCIGYAYDYDRSRRWYGYMSEVRLWTVARTANQIRENMMYVDPKTDGLVGYWKLNGEDYEKRNDQWVVLDQSPHHNDATSNIGIRGENPNTSQTFAEPTVVDMRVEL
ncbi:DUF1735 and LamG domain-containing protein [Bacteroides reticulotermitis]|uniref:Patatin-like protein n=2 Tax=Bacteroides reticulotermitis TaxID=1133319 RepID=W4UU43_9BACE|nr:DUF1735 and LamG domain-containing protein [Bacteroides reticulotermitis]MBB4045609.1 hypothetical protein [Bacteroides reticulotermitis]GAE84416.1 patatin-like protein [Bacteroides reticulotermitis JCM 10512]